MTTCKPFLRIYGPLHALSSRGLHVRQTARNWRLIVPMTAESVAFVRGFCESIGQAEAESLLRLLSQSLRKPVEQAQTDLRRALMETEPVQQQHAERDAAVL